MASHCPVCRVPTDTCSALGMGTSRIACRAATAWDRQGGRAQRIGRLHDPRHRHRRCAAGGGDRKTLTPAGNFVRDCEIYRTDRRVHRYAEAVVVDGCGNLVEGNDLHDNRGGLLYFLGNDHLMQFNEIHRGLTESQDGGRHRGPAEPEHARQPIRFNYLHHNRGSRDHNAQTCTDLPRQQHARRRGVWQHFS